MSGAKAGARARPGRYDQSVTNHTPSVAAKGSALAGDALLRSLAGTVTGDGTDHLATREEAVPWLRTAGLLPGDAVLTGSEHGALLRMRDALRDVAAVRAAGGSDDDAAARLTRALADGRLVVTVSPAGRRRAGQLRPGHLLQPGGGRRHRGGASLVTPGAARRPAGERQRLPARECLVPFFAYSRANVKTRARFTVRSEMSTVALTEDNFEQTVTGEGITLVDWWAAWCGPCRQFGPVFESASEQNADITFGKIDTEDQQGLAAAAQITSIPTLMAFRDGVLVFSQAGALPAASLDKLIQAVRDLDMEQVRSEIATAAAAVTAAQPATGQPPGLVSAGRNIPPWAGSRDQDATDAVYPKGK